MKTALPTRLRLCKAEFEAESCVKCVLNSSLALCTETLYDIVTAAGALLVIMSRDTVPNVSPPAPRQPAAAGNWGAVKAEGFLHGDLTALHSVCVNASDDKFWLTMVFLSLRWCQRATLASNDAQLAYFGTTLSMATRDGDLPVTCVAALLHSLLAVMGGFTGRHPPLSHMCTGIPLNCRCLCNNTIHTVNLW